MLSGPLHSSGSSGRLRSQRLTRNKKNTVPGKLGNEPLGIRLGLFGIDVKLLADMVADNIPQRSAAVGSLKDCGCDLVQREESRIGRVHDHHFAGERAGGDGRTARNVNASLRHARAPPASYLRSRERSFELRPTPWHQDRTSDGEWEPWQRIRKQWREVFPPAPDLRRRTEYCASGVERLPRTTTRRRGSPGPFPEKTEPRPAQCSSRRLWPALRQKGCRMPSSPRRSGAGRKFRR